MSRILPTVADDEAYEAVPAPLRTLPRERPVAPCDRGRSVQNGKTALLEKPPRATENLQVRGVFRRL